MRNIRKKLKNKKQSNNKFNKNWKKKFQIYKKKIHFWKIE